MPFPLDARFVEDLEHELGASLPESYKACMMEKNGGERRYAQAIWYLHPIKDTSDRKRLKRTCNHVLHESKVRATYGGWPEGALEIADNQGGACLFFLKNGDHMGPEVHVWCHETHTSRLAKKDFSELLPA